MALLGTITQTLPNGHLLRLARLGNGPPLLLLHGYPDNLQIWCELAPRLAHRYTVIALDWPGMGGSEAWPGGTTPSHQAKRIHELLTFWSLDRVSLLGSDMGGQPALVFAAAYPERIERLFISNSLAYGDLKTSWEIRVLRRFGWNRLILRRLPRLVFARAERTFLPAGVRLPAPLRDSMWSDFRRDDVRRFVVRLCAGYQGTLDRVAAEYRQIACPTTIVWGERDRHFPLDHAERLHREIAGSRLAVVPHGEHWMAWHSPDLFANAILGDGE